MGKTLESNLGVLDWPPKRVLQLLHQDNSDRATML
ncbi:hypothetical protein Goarm_004437, partial [Gossypium armourianum]|nr:hypothetical protein [Gossypium lobatum]MBA0838634.1 hypothetical protein [Gossypium armourianum]